MATTLASLVVRLGLDAGTFLGGLTKSEADFKRFSSNVLGGLDLAAKGFASLSVAASGALLAVDAQLSKVAKFKDVSETIGDTAESVASLAPALGVSGTAIETVAAASVKLTNNLSRLDDESKGAGKAIAALGIDFDEFKKLGAVEQLDAIARAMAGFEDGTTKTAVAVALFGKSGAELLPFLNDLADGAERQITLTQEQINAANTYEESLNALTTRVSILAQSTSADLAPALTELVKITSDTITFFSQLGEKSSLLDFLMSRVTETVKTLIVVGTDVAFVLRGVGTEIGGIAAQIGALLRLDFKGFSAISTAMKEDAARARTELDKFQAGLFADKAAPQIGATGGQRLEAQLGLQDRSRARLNFSAAPEKKGKSAKEQQSEAERYLENLQRQLDRTKDLSVEETVLADLRSGRLKATNKASEQELLAVARRIDAAKALQKQTEDDERFAKKLIDDEAKREEERERLLQRRADEAKRLTEQVQTPIEKLNAEYAKANELLEAGAISLETYSRAIFAAEEAYSGVNEKTEKLKTLGEELGEVYEKTFGDAIRNGGKFSDLLKKLALETIQIQFLNPLIKGASSGLGDFFGNLFGGFRANGGGVNSGSSYIVGERGPELFVPSVSGSIVPNNKLGGNVSINQNFSFGNSDAGTVALLRAEAGRIKAETLAAVQASANRGGGFARAVGRA